MEKDNSKGKEEKKPKKKDVEHNVIEQVGRYVRNTKDLVKLVKTNKEFSKLLNYYYSNPVPLRNENEMKLFENLSKYTVYEDEMRYFEEENLRYEEKEKMKNLDELDEDYMYLDTKNSSIDYENYIDEEINEYKWCKKFGYDKPVPFYNLTQQERDLCKREQFKNYMKEIKKKIIENNKRNKFEDSPVKIKFVKPVRRWQFNVIKENEMELENKVCGEGFTKQEIIENEFEEVYGAIRIEPQNGVIDISDIISLRIGKELFNSIRREAIGLHGDITQIILPPNIEELGLGTFFGCTNLVEIEIPESVKKIGCGCFWDCQSLTKIDLKNVTELEDETFRNCAELKYIIFSPELDHLPDSCFYHCPNLLSIEFTDKYNYYPTEGFINIPDTVKYIGSGCFIGCESIKIIRWSKRVKTIPHSCFMDCSVEKISNCEHVTNIEEYAFNGAHIKLVGNGEIPKENILDIKINIDKIPFKCFECCAFEEISLPNTVTEIGYLAFNTAESLRRIELPQSVRILRAGCFICCDILTEIVLNDELEEIEFDCFAGCESLRKINFPPNIKALSPDGNEPIINYWRKLNIPGVDKIIDEAIVHGKRRNVNVNNIFDIETNVERYAGIDENVINDEINDEEDDDISEDEDMEDDE